MSMGKILAYSGLMEGKEVTWMPAYGPEQRGGTANVTVIVSDHIIDLIGSSNDHDLTSCLHQTFCHSITKSSCSACYDRFFSFNIK